MYIVKKVVASIALAFSATVLPAAADVYIVAHPDDDILLMGPNLVSDIINGRPTVIIVVTAGDAGAGVGSGTVQSAAQGYFNYQNLQYYRRRFDARVAAIKSWVPAPYYGQWAQTTENFGSNAPVVEKYILGNVIEYHLHLPDSGGQLRYMAEHENETLFDITNTNFYNGHSLKETIRQIISRNNRGVKNLKINYPEYIDNQTDHIDHTGVGISVWSAIAGVPAFGCMTQIIHAGYSIASQPVTSNLLDRQRQGYEILHSVLRDNGNITPISGSPVDIQQHPTWAPTTPYTGQPGTQKGTMDSFHTNFYGKSSVRTIASTQPCAF